MKKHQRGKFGEDLAADFLRGKGYSILERNFRFDRGEIDIIAREGKTLVFVEVKARHSTSFGEPEEAITPAKRDQIQKVAEGYLAQHDVENQECRFDVVSVSWLDDKPSINHIENVF